MKYLQHEDVLKTVQHALQIAESRFANFCYAKEVKQKLKSILFLESFSNLSVHCSIQLDYLIEETAEQFILQWSRYINKIIHGTQDEEKYENFMYNEARRMSLKYKKQKQKPKK